MNSDYIPRLRAELVRAASRKPTRWRWRAASWPLRPLVAAAVVALLALAVVLAVNRSNDGQPADSLRLEYRVEGGAAAQAENVMRERLAGAGVRGASVSTDGDGRLLISAPPESRAEVDALTHPGRLAIYDWERSVLGPDGAPAPDDASVTGGDAAGTAAATPLPQAERRAAAAPEGARVIRTMAGAPERWYALAGDPALTNADIENAVPVIDQRTNEPAVAVEFTEGAQAAFASLTRDLARRGAALNARQHFVILVDDRIIAVPFIDYRANPNGVDAASGAHISGAMSSESARRLSAILNSGPLPGDLMPETG